MKIGYGLDESVQMGPLRSKQARDKVLSYIELGLKEGAKLILDDRNIRVDGPFSASITLSLNRSLALLRKPTMQAQPSRRT